MADTTLRAHLPVASPDGLPVSLTGVQAPPGRVPLVEGHAGCGDAVQGQDVTEWSDVRVTDKGERSLQE